MSGEAEGAPKFTEAQQRSRDLINQAEALSREGRWTEVLPIATAAAEADPQSPIALHNLSIALTKFGRFSEGEALARQAAALAPDAAVIRHGLAHNLLAQGRLSEGWQYYDARIDLPELNTGFPRDFPFPRWRGEPLAGKRLAVFPEQGFGDQIQFVRFVPALVAQGATITLLTLRPLVRLFERSLEHVSVIAAAGRTEFEDPDYWITLAELPAVLGITLETVPSAPYLLAQKAAGAGDGTLRVGLMVKGNPLYKNDAMRSLPPVLADRLRSELPGTIVSLDPAESKATDFAETADIIAGLDLVVSVDTSVAHLAGALGKRCLLLVQGFSPDWRWMLETNKSPWYPEHRLYRGAADGTWDTAVEKLIADVHRIADARGALDRASRFRSEGRYSESIAVLRKEIASNPRGAPPYHNLARLLTDLGRLKEGEATERRALQLIPDDPRFRFGLALNLLTQGRYEEAWPHYAVRGAVPELVSYPRNIHFPHWQGEALTGKRIAVLPEQGLGDQIMFARFLPWLREQAEDVVLFAPPPLVALFTEAFPTISVIAAEGSASFPRCQAWAAIGDLPERAGATRKTLPPADYLKALFPPAAGQGGPLRIGVMTSGNAAYIHDRHRTLPAADAERLRAGLTGALVELDPAQSGAQTFLDTARLIQELDLVVSVDTSVGHLAGAMGKPCFLLVPGFATDWRWGGPEPNAWYPTHRLFRGAIGGDWSTAIATLHDAVRAFAAGDALPS